MYHREITEMLTRMAASVRCVIWKSRALLLLLVCGRLALCAVTCRQTEPSFKKIPALAYLCIPEKHATETLLKIVGAILMFEIARLHTF